MGKAAPASSIRCTPLRGLRDLLSQCHMRFHPGDHGIATVDKARDHCAAHPALGAVKAVDAPVLVALLSTAFSLKRNPRLDFRTHSNPINCHPLPLFGSSTASSARIIGGGAGAWIIAVALLRPRRGRGWGN
jgi:hypothetical protein